MTVTGGGGRGGGGGAAAAAAGRGAVIAGGIASAMRGGSGRAGAAGSTAGNDTAAVGEGLSGGWACAAGGGTCSCGTGGGTCCCGPGVLLLLGWPLLLLRSRRDAEWGRELAPDKDDAAAWAESLFPAAKSKSKLAAESPMGPEGSAAGPDDPAAASWMCI